MALFANAMSSLMTPARSGSLAARWSGPGVASWLVDRWHRRSVMAPRLVVVARINLAPRQTVALIEADGQRLLVATSPEGTPAFHLLMAKPTAKRKSA